MRIRLRLWHRLFIAIAGLSIVALATFALLQQQGLQSGFLDYLNRLSLERVSDGAARLQQRYEGFGNWDFVRDRPGELMRTLGLAPGQGHGPDGDAPFNRRPDERPPPRPDAWPPPPDDRPGIAPPMERTSRQMPGGPPPPRPAGPLDLAARLLLVDADNRPVVGNPGVPMDAPAIAIRSNGIVVGRLLVGRMPRLRGDLDLSFAQTQLQHAALMAGAVLFGALLLAWLLARWLLAPIRALGEGTRALVAGDFATRIQATRSDELGALAEDFNHLAATLEQHREARRQWGADIAHELRTPIGILRGEIQALQDGIRIAGPETLASLHSECDRIASLVEDLYQLALSDAGALAYRFESMDLGDSLSEAVNTHVGAMQDAGLELTLDALPASGLPVRADRQRIAQLFANLLGNSQRYTHAPGKVRISMQREGVQWCVQVDDTAPGVPEASLVHLCDRMYRVESSRNRSFGGAGLGLAICRNIAIAHGGTIEASASPAGGLRISLRLPIAEPSP